MNPTKSYSITILRILCAFQVFLIHYFAGHNLREYVWVFDVAVPSFILVSAYLYGLRNDDTNFDFAFIKRRWIALSCVFYPYLIIRYVFFIFKTPDNFIFLFKSFSFDIFYLNTFAIHGENWFMQTILYCYISLVICKKIKWLDYIFKNKFYTFVMMILVIACGFVYRGGNVIYVFLYLFVYYNAKKIQYIGKKYILLLLPFLFILYFLDSYRYTDVFHYGIYLNYMHRCIMGMLFILIVCNLFTAMKKNKIVDYLGLITFEFFLSQSFFAYDFPLYVCLPCTLLSSIILHYVGIKNKLLLQKLTNNIRV